MQDVYAESYAVLPIQRRNENVKNKNGYILEDYRRAIREVAMDFGIAIIDGKKLAPNPENETERQKYIPDGLHPNSEGHALYAQLLYQEILATRRKKC